ncbi:MULTISPECIES: cbb3-type cytochrome c oxidase subunit I, partial [unclassified Burkholderia]
MFGKLTLSAIPFDQPIVMGAAVFMALVALSVVGTLTYTKRWKWLWSEWLTSVDHKKIGVMYIIVAVLMLLRGFADAVMMRLQLALAYNGPGYLPPHHYDQIFTAHGVIMIFFMAMA